MCQAVPDDVDEEKASFLQFTRKVIAEGKYSLKNIINMDEVPLKFDCPPNRTVDTCGVKTVSITTTGREKAHFTVMLACCADGTNFKPLLIFESKTIPKENLPRSVIIRCNEKVWCNEDIMLDWFQEVWKKREGAFFNSKGVLIMDSMRAHIKDSVKAEAKKNIGAELSVIPGGLTKILQPLDISVNRSFKSHVRGCWENWMLEGLHTCTKGGNMRRTSYTEVAECVDKSCKSVKVSTIRSGFIKARIVSESREITDSEDSDAKNELSDILPENILELFNSDTDESDFEGFRLCSRMCD
ncbi:pogo transposable element with KRAB domain [Trichonephila clavipes]|nr:pogo transposable element with KRAB domain [Trichonephila clavipes]